jgi:HAD superfamily hydrolase (TIGR01509 family)
MPIQAVIFDLDGLMVDSEPIAKHAWRTLLAHYGYVLDRDTINALFGLRLEDSSRLIKERYDLPLTSKELAVEKNKIFMALLNGNLRPMPGLFRLLRAVDSRGLIRAVATSSRRDVAEAALRSIGADGGFAALVTADLVQNGKPAPDSYLAAADALHLPPSACLALEDSPYGVQAAKAAGMRCVAVPNEITAELDLSGADWIFPSLEVVTDHLDRLA